MHPRLFLLLALVVVLMGTACADGEPAAEVERTVIEKDALLQARFTLDDGIIDGARIDVHEDRLVVYGSDQESILAWWPIEAHLPVDDAAVLAAEVCNGASDCVEPERAAACAASCNCAELGIGWWRYDAVVVDFDAPSEDGARLFIGEQAAKDAQVTLSYCATP